MHDDLTISCDAALEALQCRLDGSAQPADPAVARHLAGCAECRARFAAAELLLSVYQPRASADFTMRLRNAVRSDSRRRLYQRVLIGATGLAAAIVFVLWWNTETPPAKSDAVVATNVPSLEKRLTGAKDALWSWSGRTVSMFGMPDISEPRINAEGIGQAVEPAAAVLAGTGKGLIEGVEPLTSSAKRAANRFWRDLPTNRE